jgi:DNA-binding transcriptional LysR family regulator
VHVAFEASTPHAVADLAERGMGVAVLPESMARSRPGLHVIALTPPLRGRLVFAWRSGGPMSPAARELGKMARQLLAVGAPA